MDDEKGGVFRPGRPRSPSWRRGRAALLTVAGALAGAVGCGGPQPETPSPPEPAAAARGAPLVVLTRNAPTTYYVDREGRPAGFEHDLVEEFAAARGYRVRFRLEESIAGILTALAEGRGDLAAAGLTRTPSRDRYLTPGPAYATTREMAVCRPGAGVRRRSDLVGAEIRIIGSSSYEATLSRLRSRLPGLDFTTTDERSVEQLLEAVHDGEIDCTVADSTIVAIDRRFLPRLRTPFPVSAEEELVWYFSARGAHLVPEVEAWLAEMERHGELARLHHRYFGHVADFDPYDTRVFYRRVESRLPGFRPWFEAAAGETGLPWTLLAALSYQESHWEPAAESPTGVRGMMMLTEETASMLGVDRLDPRQSIAGGARYLRRLVERVPGFIEEPDRTWMALAAYNVGFEHLEDARVLAVRVERDPNAWSGVKETLPLLSQRRWYRQVEHGYARGHQPVIFVEQVRNYRDLLVEAVEEGEGVAGVAVAGVGG